MKSGTRDSLKKLRFALHATCGAIFLIPLAASASFEEDLQTQIFRYASESSPTLYLSSKSFFLTDNFLMKIDGYFESGSKGAWSIDPDPIRATFRLDGEGRSFAFIGRDHPLNFIRGIPVEPTSALGTIWAQNQLEALNPRVSGWIGGGIVHDIDRKWKLALAFSPIFLPTFSPSLGFTERGEMNPSRFARLPPAAASIGGVVTPIRYRIDMGQISTLLFQPQGMLAISHDDENTYLDAYVYTAPKPIPVPNPTSAIGVNASEVNAKVDVDVQFPREYWAGVQTQFKKIIFEPAVEFVQKLNELSERYVSLTGYFKSPKLNPKLSQRTRTRASFGLLTHLQKQFDSPMFSDFLVFLKVPVSLSEAIEYRTMVQTTLLSGRESFYWINEVEWTVSKVLSVIGAIRILTGVDNSWFGDWRNHDSYSAGVRWIW